MKRREFIAVIGGAAAAWPLGARAQQPDRMRRVGVLSNLASDDKENQRRVAAFLQALEELGWTVGRNLRIDYRWGAGNAAFYRKQAADLVALAPEVVVTNGNSTTGPMLQTTQIVPVVFVNVTDPVSGGFVESLAAWPPVRMAISCSMALRRSPKPGAFTAATLRKRPPTTTARSCTSGWPNSPAIRHLFSEILVLSVA